MPDLDSVQDHEIIAARFAEYARRYCAFVDNCSELKTYDFVVQALDILATLQREALALPLLGEYNLTDSRGHVSSINIPIEREHTVGNPISDILGRYDYYLLVFDPTDVEDQSRPVASAISGDMAEIYADLQKGLVALQQPEAYTVDDILWEWKFGFIHHWGRHLADAQRTLFFIISNYHYATLEDNQ